MALGKTLTATAILTQSQDSTLEIRLSSSRQKKRKLTSEFKTLEFHPQVSVFDRSNPSSTNSPFHGFFTLFWLGLGFYMIRTVAWNFRVSGEFFGHKLSDLFMKDMIVLWISDLCMVISSVFALVLQRAVYAGTIDWDHTGWIIGHIWQISSLAFTVWWSEYRQWPWIQKVFITLHCFVMLMKQYSYATFNGYLSRRYRVVKELELRLGSTTSTSEKEKLGLEIQGHMNELESPCGTKHYPDNLTLRNFVDYLLCPTLIYELSYPRTAKIRWSYLLEKSVASVGVFLLIVLIAEHSVIPHLPPQTTTRTQRLHDLPWSALDIIFPLTTLYLLVFYLVFECILNVFAEITCFADRGFYDAWWNSWNWEQFSREWNKPVHLFLLRHVYHSSISAFKISKRHATLCTFLLSALVHEFVMAVITKKIRCYLLLMQMFQLPLVRLSRTKLFRDRKTLGNIFFWIGLFTGPSFLCLGYVLF